VPIELVTGEAVALDIRVARLASRALALLVDILVQVFVLNLGVLVVGASARVSDPAVTVGLTLVVAVVVLVGYPTIAETLTRGRTIGKAAVGLRVVSDDGGPERFRQALVRALAEFVEIWLLFGSPALFTSLLNPRGKRLGDLFAGTIVIQDRVPVNVFLGPVAIMPPPLAPWAAGVELSMVPDRIAMAARQYLTRFWELAPRVRDEMGRRLTDEIMRNVSPPPPAGFRPEIYLSAVLAERRHREERRLAERAARRAAIGRRVFSFALPPAESLPVGGPPPAPGPNVPPVPYSAPPAPGPEWLGGGTDAMHRPGFLPPTR
jgi:uncharacterized RDD family membrane protein YckC